MTTKNDKLFKGILDSMLLKSGIRKAVWGSSFAPEVGEIKMLISWVQDFIESGKLPDKKRFKICIGVLKEVSPRSFAPEAEKLVRENFPNLIQDIQTIINGVISADLKKQAEVFEKELENLLNKVK